MNDKLLEAVKAFIETKTVNPDAMKRYLVLFLIISAGTFIANTLVQLWFKRRDSRESLRKIRNEKRLGTSEKLYQYISTILLELYNNNIYSKPGIVKFSENIGIIRKWINLNSICLDKKIQNKAIEILDYVTLVLSDPRKRNANSELKLMADYKKIYETL